MKQAFLIIISLLSLKVSAQKTTVAIQKLRTISSPNNRGYNSRQQTESAAQNGEAKIEDFVTAEFVNTKRFNIVDRASLDALKSEKELQKTEDFIDSKVIAQSKTLGAEYLIGIYIASIDVQGKNSYSKYGNSVTYSCNMSFSVKIIDIATSQIIASETFQSNAGNGVMNFTKTAENAIDKCLKNISSKFDDFINNNFPIKASIANIEETNKSGAASKVLLTIGSTSGVRKGDIFKVMEITELEVDGKKMSRKKEVGSLEVISIEDENFSVCSVKEGGLDIIQKRKDGKKLIVQAETSN